MVSRVSLEAITGPVLRAGIGKRLGGIASTYFPDDESDSDAVAARVVVVEPPANGGRFSTCEVHWRRADRPGSPIRVMRNADLSDVQMEKAELTKLLGSMSEATARRVKQLLASTTEIVAFDIQNADTERSMAWSVALAAAGFLADAGKGLLHTKSEGWFEPTANDLRALS